MNRYSAIVLVLFAAGSVHAAEKTLDRTFTVSPGEALVVEADSASVQVSGNNTNQVTVRIRARASENDLAKLTLDAFQKDGEVTVLMKRQSQNSWFNWGSWNTESNIEVTVPRNYRINVRTSGGSVQLKDTTGSATLRTSGGSITVKGVTGNLLARTSGGGIFAETIRGDVDASTSGGDLRLIHVDGKVSGTTSGGSAQCSLVGANRGIVVRTSGGSIELTLPRSTAANVDATTSGGNVNTELPVTTTRMSEHHLKGSLNGGGEPIELRTSGGGISLRAAS